MLACIKGDGGRLAAFAIKRFWLFERGFDGNELTQLWKEKHGHSLTPTIPKRPKRYKVSDGQESKYCNGCERVLLRASFCVDRSRKDGLSNRCRECASRQWKKNNCQLCKSCGGFCAGHTCRRCLTIQIRVRDTEYEVVSAIPRMFKDAERELEEFIQSLSPNLSTAERLNALIKRVCGT